MKIGIFGGSFNPPHNMHTNIAISLIKLGYVDKVIFVPTGNKYNKSTLIDSDYRIDMLNIICNENKNLEVSNYETKNNLVYTYQTLDYFTNLYLDDEIFFVLGTDNLSELKTWKNSEYMLKKFKFLVVKRDIENIDDITKEYKEYMKNIVITTVPMNLVSSTTIRKMIKKGDSNISKYLNNQVIEYIKNKNLYL